MKLNLDRYNRRIREDGKEILRDIKAKGRSLGIVHRAHSPSPTASLPGMKDKYKLDDGAVNQVSFTVTRALIYTHKGAGKGRGGLKGSTWLDKFGKKKTTNDRSKGLMGTRGRREKPFINTVLDAPNGVDKLATTAAEELGDAIVANMLIT